MKTKELDGIKFTYWDLCDGISINCEAEVQVDDGENCSFCWISPHDNKTRKFKVWPKDLLLKYLETAKID